MHSDQNHLPIRARILLARWQVGKWWQNIFQY